MNSLFKWAWFSQNIWLCKFKIGCNQTVEAMKWHRNRKFVIKSVELKENRQNFDVLARNGMESECWLAKLNIVAWYNYNFNAFFLTHSSISKSAFSGEKKRSRNHLMRIKTAKTERFFYSSMRFALITSKMCRFNIEPKNDEICVQIYIKCSAVLSVSLCLGAHFKWIWNFFFNFH